MAANWPRLIYSLQQLQGRDRPWQVGFLWNAWSSLNLSKVQAGNKIRRRKAMNEQGVPACEHIDQVDWITLDMKQWKHTKQKHSMFKFVSIITMKKMSPNRLKAHKSPWVGSGCGGISHTKHLHGLGCPHPKSNGVLYHVPHCNSRTSSPIPMKRSWSKNHCKSIAN